MGIGPLLYCISVLGPPIVMVKYMVHIIFPEHEERKINNIKWNRGHHNVPDILGVKWEKFPRKGVNIHVKKPVKGLSFSPRYRGCPVRGNTHQSTGVGGGGAGLILAVSST